MPKTTTATRTFASLAQRHGRHLAYIARQDSNPTVPADPTSIDTTTLIELVNDAAAFLDRVRHDQDAETLESAARLLTEAHHADQPALLRRAARHLRDSYDMACELGDDHDF
ncbi:hypothetical protein ACIG0C_30270 [Kitasatospora aureofaciens]|uniref:hypothetical protein n=1 Tax=Kitasatospora aureofaciens TaxID=1894 RepID=UPI000AD0D1F0|nr:hypothetical protein [Kitasatospora aureofaciens]